MFRTLLLSSLNWIFGDKASDKMQNYYPIYYVKNKIYIYVSVRVDDGRLEMSTGMTTETGKLDNLPRNIQRTLDRVRIEFDLYVSDCHKGNDPILIAKSKEVIKQSIGGKKVYRKTITVDDLVTRFIEGAKDGTILNDKDKRYPSSTTELMVYAQKAAVIGGIDKVNVTELQPKHFQQLRAKLAATKGKNHKKGEEKGLSANTIETYNNLLLVMINRARAIGWHSNNLDADKKTVRAKGEDVDYAIAYSEEELMKLYNHRFDNIRLERVRDIFVFGCYTCLRHSDYYLTDYKMSLINGNILHLVNLKTGNTVYIPLHPMAIRIYEKYKGEIPKIAYGKMRGLVKDICEIAGFNDMCLFSRTHGGKLEQEHVPKWKLTTTHTMRRSFATNAFITGMPERMIMKIGGWKSYSSFERYLRLSGLDIAKLAMEQPFYKDWIWK